MTLGDAHAEHGKASVQKTLANRTREVQAKCRSDPFVAASHWSEMQFDGDSIYAIDDMSKLPDLSDMEGDMLECVAAERLPGSRLSCQIRMTDEMGDLTVTIPSEQF